MANLIRNLQRVHQDHKAKLNFRHVLRMDELDDKGLDDHGFYRGFPCPRGHTIRDKEQHWCYHCVLQIQQNICGLDVNHLNSHYRHRAARILANLEPAGWDECWSYKGKKRMERFPSYRSLYSQRIAENMQVAKIVYQLFWGDIGGGQGKGKGSSVTRLCGNKDCYNPLHLVSNWNMRHPPTAVFPLNLTIEAEKQMLQANLEARGYDCEALIRQFRNTITHPTEAPGEPPEHEP